MGIKVREVAKGTIKTLDKSRIVTEKTKDNIVNIKEKSEEAYSSKENNSYGYASDRLLSSSKNLISNSKKYNSKGYKGFRDTKNNIVKTKEKIKTIKSKLTEKKKTKKATNNIKSAYNKLKKEKKVAQETVKASKNAKKFAQVAAKKTYQTIKESVKITYHSVKAIIMGIKALISALFALGWVSVLIIIIIMFIGLLCGSIYGIFFSSEDTGNGITMSKVVKDINIEMSNKIINIQNSNDYDDYKIISNRAEWKEVLMIYVAKVSEGTMEQEVLTIDDSKVKTLKGIFWDMHSITSKVKEELVEEVSESGESQKVQKRILYITISSKSAEDMMDEYNFNTDQRKQITELSRDEFSSLWVSPIYGASLGSPSMVQIALQEIGNVGGEKYWSWYGFTSRVEWCAIFVSWVANEAGYIESKTIPKFAGVWNGVDWFKALGQWHDSNYIPNSGDIIFFDWEVDGKPNHVGIVEKVENNTIYTIEGNSNDESKQKEYSINSNVIFGYGVPAY